MFRRSLMALAAVLLAFVLFGCGSGTGSSPSSGSSAPAGAIPAFPVTIHAPNGDVTLAERPTRIVSLSPTATESLFAIGAGAQVTAVDDQSNYPARAPQTKLSGFEPNVEAIARYRPDLVITSFDPGALVKGLEKLDIPVVLQPAAADLAGAYAQISQLGRATGHVQRAAAVVKTMRARMMKLAEAVSGRKPQLSVYHELGPDFFSATSKSFIGSVYKELGLRNIADDAGGKAPDYPQLSAEFILSADPDLIVLADTKCCGQTPETIASRPGWKTLTAVQRGNVVPVDDDIASRWGPRTVEFAEILVRAVERAQ